MEKLIEWMASKFEELLPVLFFLTRNATNIVRGNYWA
jgi:hypothetical protein